MPTSAGIQKFWQALKQLSGRQRQSVDRRNAARDSGAAIPESWISFKQANDYYKSQGGLEYDVSIVERQERLSAEKQEFLDKLFYGKFRSGIGLRALWQALMDTQKQQDHIAAHKGRGWISFHDLRSWYLQQESAQLMRNAPVLTKTKVRVPDVDDLLPLKRMQADSISFVGAKSGRYTGVLHVIDLFSQFTWAIPVVTVGSASNTAAAFAALLQQAYIEDSCRPEGALAQPRYTAARVRHAA